jgi:S-(hydroxymethyl)glutathione dehydrogenase/alcohol dehydrogenase
MNVPGSVYKWNGTCVNAGSVTTFGRQTVASENRITVVSDDIDLQQAALLGCAVPTGVGAVFNTARPKPGQSIAVFGTGGIGICAINAADVAGCAPIIAVDILDSKLQTAIQIGATHTVNASKTDPVEQVKRICPGGVDFTIEAAGVPSVMVQALQSVRNQGGIAVIVGNAHHGQSLTIDPCQLNNGKQLRGTWGGDSQPDEDFPRYAKLIIAGKLNVRPLLSRSYTLDNINDAIDDLEAGLVVRPLIDLTKG